MRLEGDGMIEGWSQDEDKDSPRVEVVWVPEESKVEARGYPWDSHGPDVWLLIPG